MKVLFIRSQTEEDQIVLNFMASQYPRLELVELIEDAELIPKIMEQLLQAGPFDFVIVLIKPRKETAQEIYHTIIDNIGQRPFIFIGKENIVKFQSADYKFLLSVPHTSVHTIPINSKELKSNIDSAIDFAKKEEFEESIQEFDKDEIHPIRLRNFYLFEEVPYDVYVQITANKFGKVITKNNPYSHHLLRGYTKKNIKYFYLKKDEHLKFLSNSIKNLIKLYELEPAEKKRLIILHIKTAFFIQQFIKSASVSDDVNKLMHYFVQSVTTLVRQVPHLPTLLDYLGSGTINSFAEKSVLTAYVCEFITSNMGWNAEITHGKLLLASLLQDIALENEDLMKIRSLNDPNLKMFSEEIQIEFKNHPQKGALISNYFHGFTDVDFILAEHHEHPSGTGFPKGQNSTGLTTISCLFILATNFVTILSEETKTQTIYKDVINSMKKNFNKGNFKDPFAALERSIKNTK